MSALVVARDLELRGRLARTDLELSTGEITCLIGPNGSGKTSLLHALARIGRPHGTVTIAGLDPDREPPSRRGHLLSYLSASRELAWPLLVRDLIALGLPEDVPQSRIAEMLALFELEPLAARRVDQLSTGERSRLLIARTLAPNATLLLLDEPTANLDPLWQLRLMEHLTTIVRGTKHSALVALHDMATARRYADRLLIMDGGRVEADGTADALLAGEHIARVFGIQASEDGWRPLSVG